MVETSAIVAQRQILARLRDETFFDLGPLNQATRVFHDELNDLPMKKLGVSRRVLFERLDRPALRPSPTTRYVLVCVCVQASLAPFFGRFGSKRANSARVAS